MKTGSMLKSVRQDASLRFRLTSDASMVSGILFAVYNAVMWIIYRSPWNISIAIYYMLLAGIRSTLVLSRIKADRLNKAPVMSRRYRICMVTHGLLLFMNLALCAPVALMVMGQRSWSYGLIPAIAVAAYTTLRITLSIMNYFKTRKSGNLLAAELRTVNLVDSLVAVLSLQNTLIIAVGKDMSGMILLTAWTSAGILLLILVITVLSLRQLRGRYR